MCNFFLLLYRQKHEQKLLLAEQENIGSDVIDILTSEDMENVTRIPDVASYEI